MEEVQSLQAQNDQDGSEDNYSLPDDIRLPFSDCVLVSNTGQEFPSIKGLLALKCSVFKGIVEGCTSEEGPLRIPLTDSDEAVELFWRQLHGIDPPLNVLHILEVADVADIEIMVADINLLIEPAHKYDFAECIDLIDATLALPEVFDVSTGRVKHDVSGGGQRIKKDKKRIMQTWSLACQYSLHKVLAACESQVFPGLKIKRGRITCDTCRQRAGNYVAPIVDKLDPDQCLADLSATGLHNAAVSLIKILNKYMKQPTWID